MPTDYRGGRCRETKTWSIDFIQQKIHKFPAQSGDYMLWGCVAVLSTDCYKKTLLVLKHTIHTLLIVTSTTLPLLWRLPVDKMDTDCTGRLVPSYHGLQGNSDNLHITSTTQNRPRRHSFPRE